MTKFDSYINNIIQVSYLWVSFKNQAALPFFFNNLKN